MEAGKPKRGRPKTLNREAVLNSAMMSYWQEGPLNVSINDICKRTEISKPSLYREFGNEDKFKSAVLDHYFSSAFAQVFAIIHQEKSFHMVLSELIEFLFQDRAALGLPEGCLHASMYDDHLQMGQTSAQKAVSYRDEIVTHYAKWIDRAKADGEFSSTIETAFAAQYLFAQITNAMAQLRRGEDRAEVRPILELALSALK